MKTSEPATEVFIETVLLSVPSITRLLNVVELVPPTSCVAPSSFTLLMLPELKAELFMKLPAM
ncbi:MAG: hypothetical protein HY958_03650 [Bacteroidia bacterium]|nr:hypothetical protein [Bacteroidia bacterium]